MVGAEESFPVGEVLLVEFDGLAEVACGPAGKGEVVAGAEGVGVVGAEESFPVGEVLLVEFDGLAEAACGLAGVGEGVAGVEGVGVVGAEDSFEVRDVGNHQDCGVGVVEFVCPVDQLEDNVESRWIVQQHPGMRLVANGQQLSRKECGA